MFGPIKFRFIKIQAGLFQNLIPLAIILIEEIYQGQQVLFCSWGPPKECYCLPSCQNATALAAATLRESTPWDMGMRTV